MKLDATCGCGASIDLDSGTSGAGTYPYVPEGKVVDTFKAWMAEHQQCRSLAPSSFPTQEHYNRLSTLHGEKFDIARELFERLKQGEPLTPEETAAYDRRIYGEGRPVAPHVVGPAVNTSDAAK